MSFWRLQPASYRDPMLHSWPIAACRGSQCESSGVAVAEHGAGCVCGDKASEAGDKASEALLPARRRLPT